jgi:uncharacterized protein involved in outer membrane biogenesis
VLGVAALLGVLMLGGELLQWPFLKRPLQAVAQSTTQAEIRFGGDFATRLFWQPHVSVQRLTVSSPPYPGLDHLLDATEVKLRWRWGDLWRVWRGQPLRVKSLHAQTLDAQLVRDMDGRASWQIFGADNEDEADLPRFDVLSVGRGHIRFTDAPLATHIDVDVQGAEGAGRQGYKANAVGLVRALPLDLTIEAGGALPLLRSDQADGTQPVAAPLRVQGSAGRSKLRFVGTASSMLDAQRLTGELRFSGPSLAAVGDPLGLTLPRTPAFDLDAKLAHDAGVWTLVAHRFHIGRSRLGGDFVFDTTRQPGKLSGSLEGRRLLLSDLGPALGTGGEGGAGAELVKRGGERVLPTREFDLPSLRAMDADVAVAIDVLDLGSTQVAPLRSLRTQVVLNNGRLQLQQLEAQVAGGRVWGTSGLDGNGEVALWNADLRFGGVEIARWLRGLANDAPAASKSAANAAPDYLTGELLARLNVTGRGRSTAQILGSLAGQAQARLRNGTVSHLAVEAVGLDIADALGVTLRGDRALALTCARVALDVNHGVFSTLRAVADTSDSVLIATGTVDLNDEHLDLRVTSLPKDFSPLTLRTPIRITGTLAEPVVGIEGGRLAGKLVAAAALGLIAPPAALLAFLDFGEAAPEDPCTKDWPAAVARQAAGSRTPIR